MLVGFKPDNHPQQQTRDDVDDRGTPHELFAPLHEQHRFTVDAAAAAHNAMMPRFWTRQDNGLVQPWRGERVWCNPPYSNIRPWVEKAWAEFGGVELVCMLLPANRTEQAWWQELIEPYRDAEDKVLTVKFLPGRIRFRTPGKPEGSGRPPFGNCLVLWDHRVYTGGPCGPVLDAGLFHNEGSQ